MVKSKKLNKSKTEKKSFGVMTRKALKVKLETPKSLRCGLERVKDLYYITIYIRTAGSKIGARR